MFATLNNETMDGIKHWTEAINKWDEYKNTHTKEEILSDMEDFFGMDSDGELSKLMAYVYYDVTSF